MTTINLTCDICGNVFERRKPYYDHRVKKGQKNFYCGIPCMSLAKRQAAGSVTIDCAHCGKTFDAAKSEVQRNKQYCSKKCYDTARHRPPVTLSCPVCDTSFEVSGRVYFKRKNRHPHGLFYCSRKCSYSGEGRAATIGRATIIRTSVPKIVLTDCDLGYLAGIVDGEGSIMLRHVRGRMACGFQVANTDERILYRLYEMCDQIGSLALKRPNYQGSDRKPVSYWTVNAVNHLRGLLPVLIPALTSKADRARYLLEYCERRAEGLPLGERDYELAELIRNENQGWRKDVEDLPTYDPRREVVLPVK